MLLDIANVIHPDFDLTAHWELNILLLITFYLKLNIIQIIYKLSIKESDPFKTNGSTLLLGGSDYWKILVQVIRVILE